MSGARMGRPPLTLALLIAERRFTASNRRHLELLEVEDVPYGYVELARLQRAFRWSMNRSDRAALAGVFAERVAEGPA